jgi:hypothetical protein
VSLATGALACGAGGSTEVDPASVGSSPDAAVPPEVDASAWTCGAPAPSADPCQVLPQGALASCGPGPDGAPSANGYLDITMPDGTHLYTCATLLTGDPSVGYWFDASDALMSDAQSCCGGAPTQVEAPLLPPVAVGTLGALHGPREIKPQEHADLEGGPIRINPFAVIVRDQSGANAYVNALASWQAWAGDGNPHQGADGQGYYFPSEFPVNYALLETSDGQPIVVIAPEVSVTSDGEAPLGHPTLGACPTGGGAPLVLMAGEIWGDTLTNHSGRFNHHPSVTEEALADAVKLFNCFGISITRTTYYPPKP